MPPDTRTRSAGPGDPIRDAARAAALHRLAVATAPTAAAPGPAATGDMTRADGPAPVAAPVPAAAPAAVSAPAAPAPVATQFGTTVPWATKGAPAGSEPDGVRPERIPPAAADPSAWTDPPWWRRVRWAPNRVAGVALVVLVLALGVFSVHRLLSTVPTGPPVPDLPLATPGETVPAGGPSATSAPGSAEVPTPGPDEEVVVSVIGLVGRSGLVTVTPGARVADALERAGGVLEGGDRDGLNLARRVADGEQILVGLAPGPDGPRGPRSGIVGAEAGPAPGDVPAGPAGAASPPPAGPAAGGLLDLNRADAAALDTLPGVGPVTAASILAWRAANGAFASVDQLAEVDGIGPATLARLRPLVTV